MSPIPSAFTEPSNRLTSCELPLPSKVPSRGLGRFSWAVGVAIAVAIASSLHAEETPKAARGQPIKPLVPRGEPIQSLPSVAPSAGSAATLTTTSIVGNAVASIGEYSVVGFDKLSGFKYEVPEDTNTNAVAQAKSDEQIPEQVRDFNGKRVALKGFMLPLKVEGGLVTELLIMRDQSMCCYGAVPKINEWVSVKMTSKGVKPVMDQAVTLFGKLKVGGIRENGYLVGIYGMDGEKMDGPPGL